MFKLVIEKLLALFQANALLQQVYTYERADPTGTPFATITPAANESAYETTTQNRRTYGFLIRLFVERKGQSEEGAADAAMRDLVDSVLDDLDSNWNLSGLGTKTGYTFLFMEAAPSAWGYVGRENEYRVADIVVRVHFSVDVNLI
jgi:hypothetical protein